MHIRPTESGGRRIEGHTPLARFQFELEAQAAGELTILNAAGEQVGRGSIELLAAPTPQPQFPPAKELAPEEAARGASRLQICKQCPEYQWDSTRSPHVPLVKCRACGCGGLRLVDGECPLRNW